MTFYNNYDYLFFRPPIDPHTPSEKVSIIFLKSSPWAFTLILCFTIEALLHSFLLKKKGFCSYLFFSKKSSHSLCLKTLLAFLRTIQRRTSIQSFFDFFLIKISSVRQTGFYDELHVGPQYGHTNQPTDKPTNKQTETDTYDRQIDRHNSGATISTREGHF